MKVKYIKDFEFDTFMIWVMLSDDDPSGVENRARSMGISRDVLKKVHGVKNYDDVEDFLTKLATEKYRLYENKIDKAILEYQKSWDKINDYFSSEIERITQHKWDHDLYKVVVSAFHQGISNNGGDTVVRIAFEDPEEQRRITAHEILMSHIWNIFYDKYPESKNDVDMLYWGLNEVITVAVLGLEPSLNKLWRKEEQGYEQYLSNYPQLQGLKPILKKVYINKAGFNDYLKEAVLIGKKNLQ